MPRSRILLVLVFFLPALARPQVTIWSSGGQLVNSKAGQISGARDISILRDGLQVAVADQLTFSYDVNPPAGVDFRQALVIDTNAFMRLRHLDGLTVADSEDPPGTSFKLPPGLILDDGLGGARYFLTAKVKTINLVTTESARGELRLEMTGAPVDGAGIEAPVNVQWTLTIPQPRNETTAARLEVAATFAHAVSLHNASFANAEAFRAAEFSSSNVPPDHTGGLGRTRDADNFRLTSATGVNLADLALDTTPINTLFFGGGAAFDGQIALNQLTHAPLNIDPPNLAIKILRSADAPEYRAQGYITVDGTTDQNSDNLGAWASRTLSSRVIPAGQQFAWKMWIVASEEPANGASQLTVTTGASGVAYNGVTLNGSVNPNGLPTTVHFEYGLTTAYGTTTADQSAGAGTSAVSVSATVDGLTPSTVYHFRVVATNSDGAANGEDLTFTTTTLTQSTTIKDTWTWCYSYAGTLYNHYGSIGSTNLSYAYYYLYYGYGEYYRYKAAGNAKRASASYWWFYASFAYFYQVELGDYISAIDAYNTYVAYAYQYLR